jgi:hypothetical protein
LAWSNSIRRDLEALGVLDAPSGNGGLLSIHPADMTDEQLDAAIALSGCEQDLEAPSLDCGEDVGQ